MAGHPALQTERERSRWSRSNPSSGIWGVRRAELPAGVWMAEKDTDIAYDRFRT